MVRQEKSHNGSLLFERYPVHTAHGTKTQQGTRSYGRKAYHLSHEGNLHLHPYCSYCGVSLLVLEIIPMNQNQPPTAPWSLQLHQGPQSHGRVTSMLKYTSLFKKPQRYFTFFFCQNRPKCIKLKTHLQLNID